jgi:hypothetical protein
LSQDEQIGNTRYHYCGGKDEIGAFFLLHNKPIQRFADSSLLTLSRLMNALFLQALLNPFSLDATQSCNSLHYKELTSFEIAVLSKAPGTPTPASEPASLLPHECSTA